MSERKSPPQLLAQSDSRKLSPPYGYSCECTHSLQQQLHIVAEFHVHRIPANRIAYRIGIDLALIEDLLSGKEHRKLFKALLAHYRKKRRTERLKDSTKIRGIAQAEQQEQIEKDYLQSLMADM
jgi:hypothetical protein